MFRTKNDPTRIHGAVAVVALLLVAITRFLYEALQPRRVRDRASKSVDSAPAAVPWEVAGSPFVAGVTAYTAVRAVRLAPGDTVAIAGAAGGVGSIAVQLARRAGAAVLGIAGPSNDKWLSDHDAVPSTMETICRPDYRPQHIPDTSTPCWIFSVGGMSPWQSKTSNSRRTGTTPSPISTL
jgi:hypothetical protein